MVYMGVAEMLNGADSGVHRPNRNCNGPDRNVKLVYLAMQVVIVYHRSIYKQQMLPIDGWCEQIYIW